MPGPPLGMVPAVVLAVLVVVLLHPPRARRMIRAAITLMPEWLV
jgi:hypothetical protein